jgi:hypothetical protein
MRAGTLYAVRPPLRGDADRRGRTIDEVKGAESILWIVHIDAPAMASLRDVRDTRRETAGRQHVAHNPPNRIAIDLHAAAAYYARVIGV